MRGLVIIGLMLLLSSTAWAKEFCYYWVDKNNQVTTYETPPFDVSGPPFTPLGSQEGQLIITQTEGSCAGSSLTPTEQVRATTATYW